MSGQVIKKVKRDVGKGVRGDECDHAGYGRVAAWSGSGHGAAGHVGDQLEGCQGGR